MKKKKGQLRPSQLTLNVLRRLGCLAERVEYWNPWARIRHDLFGLADILAIVPDQPGVTFLQVTATRHGKEKIRKATVDRRDILTKILAAGNRYEVWCWERYTSPNRRKRNRLMARRWRCVLLETGDIVVEKMDDISTAGC